MGDHTKRNGSRKRENVVKINEIDSGNSQNVSATSSLWVNEIRENKIQIAAILNKYDGLEDIYSKLKDDKTIQDSLRDLSTELLIIGDQKESAKERDTVINSFKEDIVSKIDQEFGKKLNDNEALLLITRLSTKTPHDEIGLLFKQLYNKSFPLKSMSYPRKDNLRTHWLFANFCGIISITPDLIVLDSYNLG
jgi:hypothetical protein